MNLTETLNSEYARRILENLNSAVLLFSDTLHLQYMNPAAEMLFSVSARHMLGLSADQLIHCPLAVAERNLQRTLSSGHPFTERELNLPLLDGRQITVDCTVVPLTGERGDDSGILVEIQQIDRQLRISREEQLLSQHEVAKELIRGLAHEIKNPLGGLRGAAQLLERELADPSLCEYTQIIINEADRLQSLMDRMLGPNKLPQIEAVNIHSLLERVRQLVIAESGRRLEIGRDYDPSIPELCLDKDRIIQALLNIVRNAAREIGDRADGRILLQTRVLRNFTIGSRRYRLVLQIGIEDNGPGVPERIREKLFYPMVTGSSSGMGLGLSISQSLINQHGGLVECESVPGKTVFRVLLPLEITDAKM